jgi:Brp/Blh family beta-carotene 15,15'-monooxygenase
MNAWFPAFYRRHTISVVWLLILALAISPFVPSLPLGIQLSVLAVAVTIFGLPHGALDLALVRGATGGSWRTLAAALALYLLLSSAVLAGWLAAPVIALLGFLAIAIIHFGLGDTEDLRGPQRAIETLARGGFAGVAPMVFHPQTTRDLFALLVGPSSTVSLDAALAVFTPPASWLWMACLAIALAWRLLRKARSLPAIAELLLTTALFAILHPLAAFLLYFCFIHSVRHIADLAAARFPASPAQAGRWLLLESLPFTIASILLALIAWFAVSRSIGFDEAVIRILFWGLSALTLPHMVLTAWWHHRGDPRPGDLFSPRGF